MTLALGLHLKDRLVISYNPQTLPRLLGVVRDDIEISLQVLSQVWLVEDGQS